MSQQNRGRDGVPSPAARQLGLITCVLENRGQSQRRPWTRRSSAALDECTHASASRYSTLVRTLTRGSHGQREISRSRSGRGGSLIAEARPARDPAADRHLRPAVSAGEEGKGQAQEGCKGAPRGEHCQPCFHAAHILGVPGTAAEEPLSYCNDPNRASSTRNLRDRSYAWQRSSRTRSSRRS